jgi:two-component system, LytTR family, sensor kinase
VSLAARWGLGLLAVTLLSVFSVAKEHMRWQGDPRLNFGRALVHDLILWYSWVLLTPLVFAAARRFRIEARSIRNVLVHVPIAFALIFAAAILRTLGRQLVLQNQSEGIVASTFIAFRSSTTLFLVLYAATVAVYYATEYYAEYQRRATREAQLEAALARARLEMLRRQLQPHFLFNTLNAVSALMGRDVAAARRMISRLSDLLREALDDDAPDETTLDEELRLLDRYVDIQRIRFGDRLHVTFDIDAASRTALLPRLILQPLVENAIQHGVGKSARGGQVDVIARRVSDRLVVTVRDDGPGAAGEVVEGVGLGNTRARLAQLFGANHELTLDASGPGFTVTFSIPARAGAQALTA